MTKLSAALNVAAIATLVLLSACTPKAEPKTVDYYVEHQAEWQKVFNECKNNPGKLKDDPDCINASHALAKIQATKPAAPIRF